MSAMVPEKTLHDCPACGRHTLVDHCSNRACGWMSCRAADCDLQFDMRKRRGHRLVDGQRVRWVA